MSKQIQKISPDYQRIYSDIIDQKPPNKKEQFARLLSKNTLSLLDILELNHKIFGATNKQTETQNQKHRSYQKSDIFFILDYQKKHQLNNSQLAQHLSLSRNTVSKWKKLFF